VLWRLLCPAVTTRSAPLWRGPWTVHRMKPQPVDPLAAERAPGGTPRWRGWSRRCRGRCLTAVCPLPAAAATLSDPCSYRPYSANPSHPLPPESRQNKQGGVRPPSSSTRAPFDSRNTGVSATPLSVTSTGRWVPPLCESVRFRAPLPAAIVSSDQEPRSACFDLEDSGEQKRATQALRSTAHAMLAARARTAQRACPVSLGLVGRVPVALRLAQALIGACGLVQRDYRAGKSLHRTKGHRTGRSGVGLAVLVVAVGRLRQHVRQVNN